MVYTGFEGLSDEQEEAMRSTWDHVSLLNAPARRPKPLFKHHRIDQWYPRALDTLIDSILKTWRIDACLANYVWCSRWLTRVPRHIPTFLDTHDRFADRHARLHEEGLPPDWFSTSKRGEAKALRRADTVLAIQDEEAEHFRSLTNRSVVTLGHLIKASYLSTDVSIDRPIKFGYLASNNPLNLNTVTRLGEALQHSNLDPTEYELHLAGPVSDTPEARGIQGAVRHGFVSSPEDFYDSVDVILNPHLGGTGLKIKSVEALAYGKPLIATTWAMIGIATTQSEHQCESIESCVGHMKQLIARCSNDKQDLLRMAEQSKSVFESYASQQRAVIDSLFSFDSTLAPTPRVPDQPVLLSWPNQ